MRSCRARSTAFAAGLWWRVGVEGVQDGVEGEGVVSQEGAKASRAAVTVPRSSP